MKKSLLALAVLGAFAGAASAQSSVTIYGSFDGGVRNLTNVDAAGDSKLTMGSNGTYNSNRIGFKDFEDLGGGMNAHFNLESGFNTGTGTIDLGPANPHSALFNRISSVGLGSSMGTLDLGRQYNVAFKTERLYDPFNYQYPSIAYAVPSTGGLGRFDNDIQYLGTFGPVIVRAEYALGEVPGAINTGSGKGVAAAYANGPVYVGGAYTRRNVAGLAATHYTLGGAYNFGTLRASIGYVNDETDTATSDDTTKYTWAGLGYAVSPTVDLIGAWYQNKRSAPTFNGKKDLYMLSATYAFSKRTSAYAEIDATKLKDSYKIGTQTNQTGISVGINHNF